MFAWWVLLPSQEGSWSDGYGLHMLCVISVSVCGHLAVILCICLSSISTTCIQYSKALSSEEAVFSHLIVCMQRLVREKSLID